MLKYIKASLEHYKWYYDVLPFQLAPFPKTLAARLTCIILHPLIKKMARRRRVLGHVDQSATSCKVPPLKKQVNEM